MSWSSEDSASNSTESTEGEKCKFCSAETDLSHISELFTICTQCKESVKTLVSSWAAESKLNDIFGFKPVGRDYVPDEGELMFLSTESQFYKIEFRCLKDSQKVIYLQPVPDNKPAISIREVTEKFSEAMASDDFYKVAVDAPPSDTDEIWWATAMAFAPDPSEQSHPPAADQRETSLDSLDPSDDSVSSLTLD